MGDPRGLLMIWAGDSTPPFPFLTEGNTRTNATQGLIGLTFTPLKGMSSVVARYLLEQAPDRVVVNMTINDALHYTEEQRAQIIASYPAHEREARTKGIPSLGSGRIRWGWAGWFAPWHSRKSH